MNKKSIFTSILGMLIFSLVFSYSLVYAGTGLFSNTTSVVFKLSDNIYLDSIELQTTKILFKSGENIKGYEIKSECNIFSKFTYNKGNYYMFDIKFFDNKCTNTNFILVNNEQEIISKFNLNLISEYNILYKLLDLKSTRLTQLKNILTKRINKLSIYGIYNKEVEDNYYNFLEKNRLLQESIYNRNLITKILDKRSQKYKVPVEDKIISIKPSKLPNAGRPYRDDYTDGIHHGWDVDAEIGDSAIALDDGIIIRVVNDFHYTDLGGIKRGNNLSYVDKLENLDTLRGNQVWLRTMKGDVAFYSHLNKIYDNIKVGEVVIKGQPIGTVGITGVPDKNYTDYHLHIPVHKNTYENTKDKTYLDYMKWDWYFKGESNKYILDNQKNIFE